MNYEILSIETTEKIAKLQKENEDLKTIIRQYVDIVLHDRKEIDRLNNIINELKGENNE